MTKSKNSVYAHNKHKKILKEVKGYYNSRSKTYKIAKQSFIKSKQYQYRDRKNKKRQLNKLFIIKINAESRNNNISYNKLKNLLKEKFIIINKKMLSIISELYKNDFKKIINKIQN